MKTKLSTLEAINRYQKKNVIQLNIRLNKKTDADIIAALDSVGNKQGYIKELIRLDILKDNSVD
jgi:hypothetical protein